MGGGIIQLVATGAQDTYLTGNPDFTYFSMVYKHHTNFAMESIKLAFDTKPTLNMNSKMTFTCTIDRNADLMREVYLIFALPDIWSDDQLQFQWINNVANYMIDQYTFNVDGQPIDVKYGEWMDIWNELTLPLGKKETYNRMTGNIEEFVAPKSFGSTVQISSNWLSYSTYPASNDPLNPSIKGRTFYLPLDFWFCRSPALAFPLIAMQGSVVTITMTFQPISQLYQLFEKTLGKYVSPSLYSKLNPLADVSIGRFMNITTDSSTGTTSISTTGTIDLNAYLEVNYVYLDTPEQYAFANKPHDFLIESVYRYEASSCIGFTNIVPNVRNPVKELVWLTRRTDVIDYNDWSNYTNSIPADRLNPILVTGRILFNGSDRFAEKPADYFNLVQPFQHHSNSPKQGVYCYNFGIFPEKLAPSGTANMSIINNATLALTLAPIDPDYDPYAYDIIVYSINYNIFRIMSGSGSLVYTK